MEQNQRPHSCDECRRYAGILNVRPDSWYIISAIAQLERDLIAERVRNGMAAAKARGAKIGREKKRNSVLIQSLLDAGFSFRTIARLAKCSHGSVSAEKKVWLAKKLEEERKNTPHVDPKESENQEPPTIIIPPEIAARIAQAGIKDVECSSNSDGSSEA